MPDLRLRVLSTSCLNSQTDDTGVNRIDEGDGNLYPLFDSFNSKILHYRIKNGYDGKLTIGDVVYHESLHELVEVSKAYISWGS